MDNDMPPPQNDDTFDERRREPPLNLNVIIALGGLTLAFLVQFGGTIWWGATLAANVQNIRLALDQLNSERYTKNDADRDIRRLDQRSSELTERIRRLEEINYGTLIQPPRSSIR